MAFENTILASWPACLPTRAKRLSELEQRTEGLALTHDTFSRNTRAQLRQHIQAVNQLMAPSGPPKRPIGFIHPEDKAWKKPTARNKG